MNGLFAAVQFITILPTGRAALFDPKGMIQYFPAVGILLGLMVSVFDRLAQNLWTQPVTSVLDVVLLVLVTGAFHLDGLGDAADGLLGHRPKEKALAIMKDSRIGVMGLVAIVTALALKCCGIMELQTHRSLLLVLIPAYSRAAMLFGIRFFDYGRAQGTGHALFDEKLELSAFWGLLIPVGLSVLLGWTGILLNLWFAAIVAAILFYYKRRLGCITGDMLGAMTEVTESVLFLMIAI